MRADLNSRLEALVSRRRGSGATRSSVGRGKQEQHNRTTGKVNALIRDTVVPSLERCAKFLVPAGMQVDVVFERWNPAKDSGAVAALRIVALDNVPIDDPKPELVFEQTTGREPIAVRIAFPDANLPKGWKSPAKVDPPELTSQYVEAAARDFLKAAIE